MWSDYLSHIEQVMDKLRNTGLTLKLKKYTSEATESTYLGHQIRRGRVRPEPSKIIAIQQLKCPTTKKEVCMSLG